MKNTIFIVICLSLLLLLVVPSSAISLTEYAYNNATATQYYDVRYPWNVIDHNTTTLWDGYQWNSPGYLRIDYGAGVTHTITNMSLYGNNAASSVLTWRFEGSNDASTWNMLYNVPTSTGGYGASWYNLTFDKVTNISEYRYYQMYISTVSASKEPLIAEISLFNVTISPTASFTKNVTEGFSPLAVQFNDTSTQSPTSWNWTFSNVTGNATQISFSTLQNPVKVFGIGNYSIRLNVSNSAGYNISAPNAAFVNVSKFVGPTNASFISKTNPSYVNEQVSFTDTTTGDPLTWNWTFGDISATNTSTLQNPNHTYTSVGNYTVSLNVTNSTGLFSSYSANQRVIPLDAYGQQDITLPKQYIIVLRITDSTNGAIIPNVTLTDNQFNTYGTQNGTFILTYGFSTVLFTISSNGYLTRQVSYVMDSDQNHTVQLTPSPANANQNTWYTPKQISIAVVTYNPAGVRVIGANLTLSAIANSLQNDQQLQTIYGINPTAANEMVNGTLLMHGTTGADGVAVFTVLSSISYRVNVLDSTSGTNYSATLFPGQDPYTLWIGESAIQQMATPSTYDSLNNTALWYTEPDVGNVTLHMRYQDLQGLTSDVHFIVKSANNYTVVLDRDLGNPGTGIVLSNVTYRNIRGDQYFWYWNASRSS